MSPCQSNRHPPPTPARGWASPQRAEFLRPCSQDLASRDQLDEEPLLLLLLPVLLPVLAEVCRHLPSVVSPAHPLDSLDVEVLAHPQVSPVPLVASPPVSLGPQVVSSLLASLVLLAANLPLASTLLRDDKHNNTPEKNMPTAAGLHRSEI